MKFTTIFLICILFISPVNALIAGTSETVIQFDNCTGLTVKITGTLPIDDGEYEFLNCSLIGDNEWDCDCYDGYELIINTTPLTLNDYTITAEYEYERESSSGGGGTGRIYHTDSVRRPPENNVSLDVDEEEEEEKEDTISSPPPPKKETPPVVTEPEEPDKEEEQQPEPVKKGHWWWLIPLIILLIIIFVIYKKYKKGGFKKEEDEKLNLLLN